MSRGTRHATLGEMLCDFKIVAPHGQRGCLQSISILFDCRKQLSRCPSHKAFTSMNSSSLNIPYSFNKDMTRLKYGSRGLIGDTRRASMHVISPPSSPSPCRLQAVDTLTGCLMSWSCSSWTISTRGPPGGRKGDRKKKQSGECPPLFQGDPPNSQSR